MPARRLRETDCSAAAAYKSAAVTDSESSAVLQVMSPKAQRVWVCVSRPQALTFCSLSLWSLHASRTVRRLVRARHAHPHTLHFWRQHLQNSRASGVGHYCAFGGSSCRTVSLSEQATEQKPCPQLIRIAHPATHRDMNCLYNPNSCCGHFKFKKIHSFHIK